MMEISSVCNTMYLIFGLSLMWLSVAIAGDAVPFDVTVSLMQDTISQFVGSSRKREIVKLLRETFADCFVYCDRKHSDDWFNLSDQKVQKCVYQCFEKIDKRVRTKYMTTINVNKLIVDYD
ncbi:hypothetical protein M514_00653 [Trichuris suis]|uniref:Tim10/DDP family zinc finger n=1 Tax=Trichuris suis TaxID=68888 RepID=A0A085N715_9BILA|nr:hypothetical protein M513_00653 [Trichuris suis]KFD65261.1 hypothetical protein M514_00653 [Trichuris suis]